MIQPIETINQLLAGLDYQEHRIDCDDLEDVLQIIPGEEGDPPDFFLTVNGMALPLTKLATQQLGRVTGIKPGVYRDFMRNPSLTSQMVTCQLNLPKMQKMGTVGVACTRENIIGVYPGDKPYVGLMDCWQVMRAAIPSQYASFLTTPEGGFEFLIFSGQDGDSIRPGVYMTFNGRPMVSLMFSLHDWSLVLGPPKASKKRKTKEACESALDELIGARHNESLGEVSHMLALGGKEVIDPTKFLSRLSLQDSFSSQAANKLIAAAAETFRDQGANAYEVTRFVAAQALASSSVADRRYQRFAHFVAFKSTSVCSACGLPS